MSENGNVTPIWVINLLFEYSWYVFMLLLTMAVIPVIVVLAYVLTFKAHFGTTQMVPTPLDSLPHISDSCDLIQNTATPNSSFACLHSAGVSSPDTTPIGSPCSLPYHSADPNQMQHTSFIRKHEPPQLPKFWLNNPQGSINQSINFILFLSKSAYIEINYIAVDKKRRRWQNEYTFTYRTVIHRITDYFRTHKICLACHSIKS